MKTTTKPLRTNSAPVREQIRKHILESITDCEGDSFDTIQQASDRAMSCFSSWDSEYEQRRTPNNQERFSDFLWGLPFSFLVYNCEIAEFLNSLGINPDGKEYPTDKTNKLYHYLIWSEIQKATA
jgi:hypothetical protein